MADNLDGLLSQDDINAALAAAGLPPDPPAEPAPAPAPAAPAAAPAPTPVAAAPAPSESPKDTRVDATGRPFDAVAAAMAAAIEAEAAAAPPTAAPALKATPFEVPELSTANAATVTAQGIDLLRDVELDVKIELGRSRMLIDDVLRLTEGSVVELDKLAGDPVDVFVNDRLVARGEVLVLNDNFCVRISDILKEEADEDQ